MKELTVAAVQSMAISGDVVASVKDHVRLAVCAARRGARLAVFPELSLTGYDRGLTRADAISPDDPRLGPLREVADSAGISIVAGAPLYSGRGLHIGAFCFLPHREPIMYTKQYLHEGEETAFVPGTGGPALSIDERTVCIAICAEIKHPQHPENAAAQGAEVYAASCFITPTGYMHDANLLQHHARSHRMAVVMANYGGACAEWASAGASAIWSSDGRLMAQGPDQGEAVIISGPGFGAEQPVAADGPP